MHCPVLLHCIAYALYFIVVGSFVGALLWAIIWVIYDFFRESDSNSGMAAAPPIDIPPRHRHRHRSVELLGAELEKDAVFAFFSSLCCLFVFFPFGVLLPVLLSSAYGAVLTIRYCIVVLGITLPPGLPTVIGSDLFLLFSSSSLVSLFCVCVCVFFVFNLASLLLRTPSQSSLFFFVFLLTLFSLLFLIDHSVVVGLTTMICMSGVSIGSLGLNMKLRRLEEEKRAKKAVQRLKRDLQRFRHAEKANHLVLKLGVKAESEVARRIYDEFNKAMRQQPRSQMIVEAAIVAEFRGWLLDKQAISWESDPGMPLGVFCVCVHRNSV